MKLDALASTARNYPYLQGLYAVPVGLVFFLTVPVNLYRGPSEILPYAVFAAGIVLLLVACSRIARHYRENYGVVTPTPGRQSRQVVACLAWAATLFGATALLGSTDQTPGLLAAGFAVAALVYCTILVGPRAHHVAVWGTVLVAGLLPIWGDIAVDWASIPIGVALMAAGLLDHRLLTRSLDFSGGLTPGSAGTRG